MRCRLSRVMTHARILALALICAWVARGQATCAANGLTLSTSGGRLGDPVSLSLTGTPFASGLFGYDPAPGPVATPIGTLCIGLSPALQTAPFVLDPAGTFAVAGTLPANPAFAGITYFLQAAAQDLSQPVGFALSNSSVMKLRQPRLFLLSPGGYLPPQGVPVPGSMRRVDALTDVVSPLITLMGMLQGAVAVRDLDWVVTAEMVGGVPKLVAYDAGTLAVAQSSVLPAAAGYPNGVYAAGTRVYVACTAGVVAYQLPSMAPQFVTPVPGAWGVFLPGGAFGYVALPTSIVPFDLVTGVASPAINVSGPGFGSAGAWTVGGGVIYVGLWGGHPGASAPRHQRRRHQSQCAAFPEPGSASGLEQSDVHPVRAWQHWSIGVLGMRDADRAAALPIDPAHDRDDSDEHFHSRPFERWNRMAFRRRRPGPVHEPGDPRDHADGRSRAARACGAAALGLDQQGLRLFGLPLADADAAHDGPDDDGGPRHQHPDGIRRLHGPGHRLTPSNGVGAESSSGAISIF